jgi:hypothetical protein
MPASVQRTDPPDNSMLGMLSGSSVADCLALKDIILAGLWIHEELMRVNHYHGGRAVGTAHSYRGLVHAATDTLPWR